MNDSLKKIQEMLEQQAALRLQPAGITGLPISTNPVPLTSLSRQNTGNDPLQLVCETYPWIDQNLLINIISKKLEVKDLVKLIPERRPTKRKVCHNRSSIRYPHWWHHRADHTNYGERNLRERLPRLPHTELRINSVRLNPFPLRQRTSRIWFCHQRIYQNPH